MTIEDLDMTNKLMIENDVRAMVIYDDRDIATIEVINRRSGCSICMSLKEKELKTLMDEVTRLYEKMTAWTSPQDLEFLHEDEEEYEIKWPDGSTTIGCIRLAGDYVTEVDVEIRGVVDISIDNCLVRRLEK